MSAVADQIADLIEQIEDMSDVDELLHLLASLVEQWADQSSGLGLFRILHEKAEAIRRAVHS